MRRSRRVPPAECGPSPAPDQFLCEGLANVSDGVVVTGGDGRILYINRVAESLLGYAPGELLGRDVSVLRGSGATDAPGAFLRKDGSAIVIQAALHDLPCPGEGGPFRVIILRDTGKESRLREQLIQSEKMSAIGQLVAGVAHDLNNPLTSILGYAQLLINRNQDPKMLRGLEVVAAEADRAARIVRNLLTVARKHVPEKRLLGLNGLVEKTLELKEHDLRVNRIEVVKDLDPELPMTLLDFHQIQQVLLNLVINAEQAIHETGKRGTLRIATARGGIGIRLIVEDDGPGIPENLLRRVFDPFFTTKPIGVGTGLGLSICHGIVAEHGGTIEAGHRPGGGARFLIELPIVAPARETPADGGPGATGPTAGAERAAEPARDGMSILVVDDEMPIQDLLVAMLSMDGHRVDTASSAESALGKVARARYDLVLSDLRMPGMSGIDLYVRLTKDAPSVAERLIFVTGDLVNPETDRFLSGTANLTLAKPFTRESLREVLKRFAERFPARPGAEPVSRTGG